MTAYTSMRSYALAVKLRSSKTILVEGPSDKAVIKRLVLAYQENNKSNSNYVVDEASLVNDDEHLAGKGNKEKILALAPLLSNTPQKINWLVDREWEGLNINSENVDILPPFGENWGFFTRGHSIENYWFSSRVVSDYLRMFYGASLPIEYFQALEIRFNAILRIANAYSFATKRLGLIKRCIGLMSGKFIVWDGENYLVNSSLNAAAKQRGVDFDFELEISTEFQNPGLHELPRSSLRWLCHGHLGEEMIWCCAANLAQEFSVGQQMIEAIERGFRNEKQAHHADMLAKQPLEKLEPLDSLIRWCQ